MLAVIVRFPIERRLLFHERFTTIVCPGSSDIVVLFSRVIIEVSVIVAMTDSGFDPSLVTVRLETAMEFWGNVVVGRVNESRATLSGHGTTVTLSTRGLSTMPMKGT